LPQKHRYAEVDALRGIAAMSVLIYHVVGHRVSIVFGAAEQPRGIFDPLTTDAVLSAIVTTIFDGSAAVVLFFVISGFVLAASLEKTPIPTPAAYLGFVVRRLLRLMPAVWFSLAVMIAILWYFNAMPPLEKMANAFWLGDGIFALNQPLWSIRVELAVSAVFPLLLFVNWLGGRRGSLVLALVLTNMTWYGDLSDQFLYLLAFQLGIMLPGFGAPMIRAVPPRMRIWLLALALAIFCASLNLLRLHVWDELIWLVIKSFTAFYILSHVVYASQMRFLLSGWAQQLGKISFGVYLFHGPLMFAAFSVLHGWVPAEFKMQTVPFGCVALAGVLPATLLLAWVSYRWVEQPCIRWGRSLAEAVPRLHPSLAADGSKLMGRIPT
jgi:peptidoglycan/LPS O-acetylase OafA/YrhL